MRRVSIEHLQDEAHVSMSERVVSSLDELGDSYISMKLDDRLKERGLTQKDLAMMTGIRLATISDMVNGKGSGFNWVQLVTVMVALRLTSFEELFSLELPVDLRDRFEEEAEANRVR